MPKISSPTAASAVVAALVVSGIGAAVPIASAATADNCAAVPNTAAPAGQHWYYHFDRAAHRKCWYLHAAVALPHHAAAEPAPAAAQFPAPPAPSANTDPPAQTDAAPPPPAGNADTTPPGPDGVPPPPHVTVLTVKTVPEPFVDATAPSQQRPPESVAPPPSPQAVPNGQNATADREPAATVDAATTAARKRSGEMFLLLAFALGIAAAFIALVGKMVGPYRTPRFADHPDAAWIRYRTAQRQFDDEIPSDERDIPFLDPQPEHGLADPRDHWIDQSPPADTGTPMAEDTHPAPVEPPSVQDIELALRILKQARQSRVA